MLTELLMGLVKCPDCGVYTDEFTQVYNYGGKRTNIIKVIDQGSHHDNSCQFYETKEVSK